MGLTTAEKKIPAIHKKDLDHSKLVQAVESYLDECKSQKCFISTKAEGDWMFTYECNDKGVSTFEMHSLHMTIIMEFASIDNEEFKHVYPYCYYNRHPINVYFKKYSQEARMSAVPFVHLYENVLIKVIDFNKKFNIKKVNQ